MIDYFLFYVPLHNISLIIMETSPLPVKGYNIQANARHSGHLSREGCLLCHTCCDTGPRFLRSHPNDQPFQSPLTTRKGMQGTYSNPGPRDRGEVQIFQKNYRLNRKKNSEEGITNSDIQKKRDIVNSKRWCSANEQLQPTFFLKLLMTKTISISIVHPY